MKFIPDFLKKDKPDATRIQPPTENEPAKSEGDSLIGRYVTGPLGGLKDKIQDKISRRKDADTIVLDLDAEKDEDGLDLEKLRKKLSDLVESQKKNKVTKAIVIVGGIGVGAAALAADIAFASGTLTLMLLGAAYSDLRNTQQIGKISKELSKIDQKIDELHKKQQPVPDYAPALDAMQTRITDFQKASAKDLPAEAAAELAKLKTQVETLQQKIAPEKPAAPPANDDASAPAQKRAP